MTSEPSTVFSFGKLRTGLGTALGARCKDLPRQYGSPSTCHRWLQEWQEQEVWERIWLTFLGLLDQQGQ
jgi:hypothetical protein